MSAAAAELLALREAIGNEYMDERARRRLTACADALDRAWAEPPVPTDGLSLVNLHDNTVAGQPARIVGFRIPLEHPICADGALLPPLDWFRARLALGSAAPAAWIVDELRAQHWPFVESPGDFVRRFNEAFDGFGSFLSAMRHILIEKPPTIARDYIGAAFTAAMGKDEAK